MILAFPIKKMRAAPILEQLSFAFYVYQVVSK